MTTRDADNLYGRRFPDAKQLSVVAAAVSMRWGLHIIAEAFGLNWQTVFTMRSGRRGKYKRARRIIAQLGKDQFIEDYLTQEVINRIESVARVPGKIRR